MWQFCVSKSSCLQFSLYGKVLSGECLMSCKLEFCKSIKLCIRSVNLTSQFQFNNNLVFIDKKFESSQFTLSSVDGYLVKLANYEQWESRIPLKQKVDQPVLLIHAHQRRLSLILKNQTKWMFWVYHKIVTKVIHRKKKPKTTVSKNFLQAQ